MQKLLVVFMSVMMYAVETCVAIVPTERAHPLASSPLTTVYYGGGVTLIVID